MQFAPSILSERLADDPWSLTLDERRAALEAADDTHAQWLERLPALVEPPAPTSDFPAFLLELPAFRSLRNAIGTAEHRADLDTATADQLQHFVDLYRTYMHEVLPVREHPLPSLPPVGLTTR